MDRSDYRFFTIVQRIGDTASAIATYQSADETVKVGLTKGTTAELEARRLIIFHVKDGINDRFSVTYRDRVRRVRYTGGIGNE